MKKLLLTTAALLHLAAAMAQCSPQFTWALTPGSAAPLQASFTNTSTFVPPAAPATVINRLNFGDGSWQYGFSGTVSHNYASPGTYSAWMITTVYDSLTNLVSCTDSVMHQVVVNYQPCYATFAATATSPGTYSFTASMPVATPGAIHNWNFGDGSPVVTGNPVSHTFSSNTPHSVTLITSAGGCTSVKNQTINLPSSAIDCSTLSAAMLVSLPAPMTAQLNNTSTTHSGTYNTSLWFFGDGSSSTSANPSHIYASAGTYGVTLVNKWKDSLTNAVLCTDSAMQIVTIVAGGNICAALHASMQVNTTAPLTVSLHNTSNNAQNLVKTSQWSFGDGATSTSDNPTHIYAAPGTYHITLVNRWKDSLTNVVVCTDSAMQNYTLGPVSVCDSLHAYMAVTTTGTLSRSFQNYSTVSPGLNMQAHWYFGDGASATGNFQNHTYAAPGSYNAMLVTVWSDSLNSSVVCSDTMILPITLGSGGGSIICDSLHAYMAVTTTGTLSRSFQNYSTAAPGLNMQAHWYFGDGTSATGNFQNHTYATPGTYNVMLVTVWSDSLNPAVVCSDTMILPVTLGSGGGSICDSLHAYMAITTTGPLSRYFQNTSATFPGLSNDALWSLGDGTVSSANTVNHTYPAAGTYNVIMINRWKDSSNTVICFDSIYQQVVVGNPAGNQISGYITWDSMMPVPAYDTFKVWLITFDSIANTLTAVDSTLASPFGGNVPYTFGAQPAGIYLIKAASLASVPGTTGFVPTYHTSSLYWSTATNVVHSGGATTNKNIWMQTGTVTSGPGFIAGNVALGAGRGTTTGIPGMLIFLRNGSSQLVSTAITDANGDFSFEHLPAGAYSVYPEAINYNTTPAAVVIGDGSLSRTGIDFERTENAILPKNITSLKDAATLKDIKVYPNPFRGEITIDNQAGHYSQVSFVTVTGQVVHRQSIKQGNNVIATTGLVPGVYFLLINGKEQTARMTITKQ
ncbi:PKD domain-containing protein [Taibaiella chishuiensis]|uniref:Putative secreted protein (Por secretion system target) n=1 Tax=Taibaiella chishuiensis TaxID=1434707 RepID=A0A2P8CYN3_9BACT|nr:PKD domain-containing protein [Taibaiella chishuiensis]PSK90047.1 putative secreted protein (Por secretion system target) [Taibaiella chishuiensis]